MIRQIEDLPENILGFEAIGVVTAGDYETMIYPMVENQLMKMDKFKMVYVLDERFEKFKEGALWDDFKIGMKHLGAWEKIALVTDVDWIIRAARVISVFIPGRLKRFKVKEFDNAVKWLEEA